MTNSQVSERFASGYTQGNGSNMFIEGDTIYSYGYHFPIAKHTTARLEGKDVVLFTLKGYSNTTSKHKRHVYHALYTSNFKIIETENVKEGITRELLEEYYMRVLEYKLKEKRARKQAYKEQYASEAQRTLEDYKLLQTLFI